MKVNIKCEVAAFKMKRESWSEPEGAEERKEPEVFLRLKDLELFRTEVSGTDMG